MAAHASRLPLALALAVALAAPAAAQREADFGSVSFAAGGGAQLGTDWDGAWEPGPVLSLRGATPYHGGLAELALRVSRYERTRDDVPDFAAIHATAGWGPVLRLPGGVRLVPTPHLGAMAFRFDDEEGFTGALRNETELTAGLAARVDIPVTGGLRIWAGGDATHVFARPAENLLFVEAGLSLTLAAPAWVGDVLR